MGIFRALGGGLIAIAFAPVTGGGSLLAAGLAALLSLMWQAG